MSTPRFTHLHCHSHYSLLDGASSIERLVGRAAEPGSRGTGSPEPAISTCRSAKLRPSREAHG